MAFQVLKLLACIAFLSQCFAKDPKQFFQTILKETDKAYQKSGEFGLAMYSVMSNGSNEKAFINYHFNDLMVQLVQQKDRAQKANKKVDVCVNLKVESQISVQWLNSTTYIDFCNNDTSKIFYDYVMQAVGTQNPRKEEFENFNRNINAQVSQCKDAICYGHLFAKMPEEKLKYVKGIYDIQLLDFWKMFQYVFEYQMRCYSNVLNNYVSRVTNLYNQASNCYKKL